MKRIEAGGYLFEFRDVLDAFVFDETDDTKPTYHGATVLKAVDILVESENLWYFIEVKDFHDPAQYDRGDGVHELRKKLKYKFRDTYLCRHAENKITKPIIYICLLANLENALCTQMQKVLSYELPVRKPTPRWQFELAKGCIVLNVERWNTNFSKWPVHPVQ
ncbi:MAG TPA: hypothetical protein DEB39_01805 [Planctomycetaceae bacterium]|nr:hypothetical protein [Planctomycetaceae bacterium]